MRYKCSVFVGAVSDKASGQYVRRGRIKAVYKCFFVLTEKERKR